MQNFDISIIVPIRNGENWIDKCFLAIIGQKMANYLQLEVCVYNDYSTDNTLEKLNTWRAKFARNGICLKITSNNTESAMGVGYAKNRAVEISSGEYLCFQDIDDAMHENRIFRQYEVAKYNHNCIVGSKFVRDPENSTPRFTRWANSLSVKQQQIQIYTSNGPTIIMPTWFCHKSVFSKVGGFSESGSGTPEDLIFFYKHLDSGGTVFRVDEILLTYYYHPANTTFSILESTIWDLRITHLQNNILSKWENFTIWNAGKQGRMFYRSLDPHFKNKVECFCDVDEHKIGKDYNYFNEKLKIFERKIPIIHYSKAVPPFIICVKLDMSDGVFENNLNSLKLEEGKDFIYFS